jgi:hypothetical protein
MWEASRIQEVPSSGNPGEGGEMGEQKRILTMPRLFLMVVVVALLALMGSAFELTSGMQGTAPALARGKTKGEPTLTVLHNPVPAGVNTAIEFSGSGFGSKERVWVTIGGEACCGGTTADSKGSLAYTTYIALDPGTYTASALVRHGHSWVWTTNCTFSVQ